MAALRTRRGRSKLWPVLVSFQRLIVGGIATSGLRG